MSPLLHLSWIHTPCASAVAGTQFRIHCKLFILYCSIRHHFVRPRLICCPGRALERKTNTQLLNRKVTGRVTECYCYETSVLFCSTVQITRKKLLSQNDGREYTSYFYISQTQDVVSQPLIYIWGFPFLTIISKLKIDPKNASFKMRSILQVERKPLKNPRSTHQAYELQITDMLAQENPYLPNAYHYLLCDVSCRCQAVVSLADITDFLGQVNAFPERHLYSRDSWKQMCPVSSLS